MGLFSSSPNRQRESERDRARSSHRPVPGAPDRVRPEPRYLGKENPEESSEQQPARDRPRHEPRGNGSDCRTGPRPKLPGSRAIQIARQHLMELTGQMAESVSGLVACDDGWKVRLDVVELERIPHTTDVLASYELQLDEQGELVGYQRVSRYYRNQVDQA